MALKQDMDLVFALRYSDDRWEAGSLPDFLLDGQNSYLGFIGWLLSGVRCTVPD